MPSRPHHSYSQPGNSQPGTGNDASADKSPQAYVALPQMVLERQNSHRRRPRPHGPGKPDAFAVRDHADNVEGVTSTGTSQWRMAMSSPTPTIRSDLDVLAISSSNPCAKRIRALVYEGLVVAPAPTCSIGRGSTMSCTNQVDLAKKWAPVSVDCLGGFDVVYTVPVWTVADDRTCWDGLAFGRFTK